MSNEKIGIQILGNSRVGKSFIANLLADTDFKSERSASSVTTKTESREFNTPRGPLVVFNVPGLIEVDKECIERNKNEVRQAFLQCPNSIIAFVFKDNNGSVSAQDVAAFKAVDNSFAILEESLVFVINQWAGAPKDIQHEAELEVKLKQLTKKPQAQVIFVPIIKRESEEQKKSEQKRLVCVMLQRIPHPHKENNPLDLDEESEATKKVMADLQSLVAKLDEQSKQKDEQFTKLTEEMKQQQEKSRAELAVLQQKMDEAISASKQSDGFFTNIGKAIDSFPRLLGIQN